MTNKEVMQMALDAITDWGVSRRKVAETVEALRTALAQPELNARELAKMRRSAWKNVRSEYKDDPECCFSLGFDAGYDAVARRVEPPVSESGAGFESLPASLIAQPEPEPVAWWNKTKDAVSTDPYYKKDKDCVPLYTAPPKREWVGLTDDEYELMAEKRVTNYFFNTLDYAHDIEAKLKGKNT